VRSISSNTRWALRAATALALAFPYAPLIVIGIYAFNERRTATWPPPGFTLNWFERAFHNPGVRNALWTSVQAGLGAIASSCARASRSSSCCRSRCPAS
jgi:putative spermidine/putrescine transport system permease protein